MKAPELLSPRGFGEALGVTRQAVQQAIKAGRLKDALRREESTGHWLIELERGRKEWEDWTDPSKRPKSAKPSGRPPAATKSTPSMFESEADRDRKREQVTHARASAERVVVDTELKRLELDEARARLVDRGEVQREAFALGRLVRDRLQAIPDRVSASLAALKDAGEVHQALAGEIARALEVLAPEGSAA